MDAFIVNRGSTVIVIDPHIKTPNSYPTRWIKQERRYIDPLGGAQYDIYGQVTRGPAFVDLPRYTVVFQGGRVLLKIP